MSTVYFNSDCLVMPSYRATQSVLRLCGVTCREFCPPSLPIPNCYVVVPFELASHLGTTFLEGRGSAAEQSAIIARRVWNMLPNPFVCLNPVAKGTPVHDYRLFNNLGLSVAITLTGFLRAIRPVAFPLELSRIRMIVSGEALAMLQFIRHELRGRGDPKVLDEARTFCTTLCNKGALRPELAQRIQTGNRQELLAIMDTVDVEVLYAI